MTRIHYTREVWELVQELKEFKKQKGERFIYSNLVDEQGRQYVDLVQEGGGVLGMALVGFTYVLEELGFRFLSLAGTSAGAINTLFMAALQEKEEADGSLTRSEQIIDELAQIDFMSFIDGGRDAVWFTRAVIGKSPLRGARKVLAALQNRREIRRQLGINPGEKFKSWLDSAIPQNSSKSLLNNMNGRPPLYKMDWKTRKKVLVDNPGITLAIVCADITTQSKIVFPEMADLFYPDAESVNPVEFVRASMSVPIFFTPYKLSMQELLKETKEEDLRLKWKTRLNYEGPIPPEVVLVDGGIMSNFPIDTLYFPDRILERPIIGVKLGVDRNRYSESKTIMQFLGNCFEGARNIGDFVFLFKNPIFKDLVSCVDVGDHNWLNFKLSPAEKIDLFKKGAKAAREFILRFDWIEYQKKVRCKLLADARAMNAGLLHVNDLQSKFGFTGGPVYDKIYHKLLKREPKEVLWIDDDYTNDSLELIVLERMNIKVTLASSSYEAKNILQERSQVGKRPAFDLIITDSKRNEDPDEGLRFCTELQHDKRYKSIPVLLHSNTQMEKLKMADNNFPKNIRNSPKRNALLLNDLIEEVVEVLR